jgi:hypothetical protein
LQTKLLIMVMLGMFIAVCIGAALIALTGQGGDQVRSPNPFPPAVQE